MTGQGQVEAQHARAQVALRQRDGVARPEGHVLERAAVLAKRDLAFRASVEIVEDGAGHATAGQGPEIFDADDPRRLRPGATLSSWAAS